MSLAWRSNPGGAGGGALLACTAGIERSGANFMCAVRARSTAHGLLDQSLPSSDLRSAAISTMVNDNFTARLAHTQAGATVLLALWRLAVGASSISVIAAVTRLLNTD